MYSLLEQIGVYFETEKIFDWSDNRLYDNYIEYNGLKIITEQHGQQHYYKQFNKNSRTVEEEQENDKYKRYLATKNGIDKYFIIDSSISTMEHMKNSIVASGLFHQLDIDENVIDWIKCDEFATSNFIKLICDYKNNNLTITNLEIADIFHISYTTVSRYISKGVELGWCDYKKYDDLKLKRKQGKIITNQRPIHCISDGKYYRGSREFVEVYEKEYGKRLNSRNIRHVCEGKRNHVNNLKFEYITQEEFNNIKSTTPELVIGEFFKLKEIA
jgi:predicted transcriptional regulator